MGSFGPLEWVIIILILVLFFGARKIPDVARGLAQGYKEFKKASRDEIEEGQEGEESEDTSKRDQHNQA